MSCAYEEKAARYAGGDLEPIEAAAVERHLAACRECAELAQALESDRELLQSTPPDLAEVDFADLRSEIVRRTRRTRLMPALLAAAAILAAVAVGLLFQHKAPAPPPSVATIPAAPLAHGTAKESGAGALARRPTPRSGLLQSAKGPDGGVRRGPGGPTHVRSKRAEPFPIPADAFRVPTKDPNVVIIWFAETKGDSNE